MAPTNQEFKYQMCAILTLYLDGRKWSEGKGRGKLDIKRKGDENGRKEIEGKKSLTFCA